jgi:hypothetical protein
MQSAIRVALAVLVALAAAEAVAVAALTVSCRGGACQTLHTCSAAVHYSIQCTMLH